MFFKEIIHSLANFYILSMFLIAFIGPIQAEDALAVAKEKNLDWAINAGAGILSGHSTYQIGGHVKTAAGEGDIRFPLSELRFELDNVPFAFLSARYTPSKKVFFETSIKVNWNSDSGELIDSDWGIFYDKGVGGASESSLDIYSESDNKVDFIFWESEIGFPIRLKKGLVFVWGVGFQYKTFSFVASDLKQTYPSCGKYGICGTYPDIEISGDVITYDIQYYIPIITAAVKFEHLPEWISKLEVGVAPILFVHDVDDHLLRSKRATSNAEGQGFFVDAESSLYFSRNFSVNLQVNYSYINARGVQRQVFYKTTGEATKGTWGEIENLVFSSQFEFILAMQFHFR